MIVKFTAARSLSTCAALMVSAAVPPSVALAALTMSVGASATGLTVTKMVSDDEAV